MNNNEEEFEETWNLMLDMMVDNDTVLPIDSTPYEIPYQLMSAEDDHELIFLSFDCKNVSKQYSKKKYHHRLGFFLDKVRKYEPILKIMSATNSELLCAILQHFLANVRYDREKFVLEKCELSAFVGLDHINIANISNHEIELYDSYVLYNYNNSKRSELHEAIENCRYFAYWGILECNNKDLIFLLNALTLNKFIKYLNIKFCAYRQLQEEMIIDSITNVVSNNKNLSGLRLDFDNIPVNLSSMDAIANLAVALNKSETITYICFKSLCLRGAEQKMLQSILNRGKLKTFQLGYPKRECYFVTPVDFLKVSDCNGRNIILHSNKKDEFYDWLFNESSTSWSDLEEIEIHVYCDEYRRLKEVMIIDSITSIVSNNKNLTSFKLDFDCIPVNCLSTDAITGLTNALIDSKTMNRLTFINLSLCETELKMLRSILKRATFEIFSFDIYSLSCSVSENKQKIQLNAHQYFNFYEHRDEKALNMLLNDIIISCSDLKYIGFWLDCSYSQLQEETIFNSIKNITSNKKKLSSMKLDFHYEVRSPGTGTVVFHDEQDDVRSLDDVRLPDTDDVRSPDTDDVRSRDTHDVLLPDTDKIPTLLLGSIKFSFDFFDNSSIDFIYNETYEQNEYNKSTNDNSLKLLLNDISSSCSDLKQIDITRINNGELASTILLHFVRNSQLKENFAVRLCLANFHDHYFNDTINNMSLSISPKSTVKLDCTWKENVINSDNRDIIGTEIEKFRLLSSWHIRFPDENFENMTFVLNALSRNKYIQSLHICGNDSMIEVTQFNSVIDSITNMVNHTKTLSKLVLDFKQCQLDTPSTGSISNLAEAVIDSETINDLSLRGLKFECIGSFQSIHSIIERKINLHRLSFDSSLLSWDEMVEDESGWDYKKHWFSASIFSNQLRNHKNSTLRELDLEYNEDNPELSKEMILLLQLLRDSHLDKLSFRIRLGSESSMLVFRSLFVDNILFMSRLCYLKFSTNSSDLCENLRKSVIEGVAQCSRTLFDVHFTYDTGEYGETTGNQMFVKPIRSVLQRNNELSACIENTAYIAKPAYPKVLVASKSTGPDVAFQLFCNLRLDVGPKEITLAQRTSEIHTATRKPTTDKHKRKRTLL